MLGMGLVQIPPVPTKDPSEAIMVAPVVSEKNRFCGGCGDQLVGRREATDCVERPQRREDDVDLAALLTIDRVRGTHPRVVDRLPLVVQVRVPFGRARHEEARIEPTGWANGRDPVAEVVHGVDRELQPHASYPIVRTRATVRVAADALPTP